MDAELDGAGVGVIMHVDDETDASPWCFLTRFLSTCIEWLRRMDKDNVRPERDRFRSNVSVSRFRALVSCAGMLLYLRFVLHGVFDTRGVAGLAGDTSAFRSRRVWLFRGGAVLNNGTWGKSYHSVGVCLYAVHTPEGRT